MNETMMDEIKRVIGPAATAKLARAVLSGAPGLDQFRAACDWSFEQRRKT